MAFQVKKASRGPKVTCSPYPKEGPQEVPLLRMKRKSSLCLTIVPLTLSILCAGCGSGSNRSNNSMSPAQAQAVSEEVEQALIQSLQVAFPASAPATSNGRKNLSTVVGDIRPDASSGCTSTPTGESCNFPISLMNYPCGPLPQGGTYGTISVTGDVDGSLSSAGDGSVSGQLTITPSNCAVSNLLVNGDPSISVAGQINFTDTAPTFPIVFTETGGISYGPNPSGSCQVNATYTINSLTSCSISGMVCGQSVSGSC